MSGKALNSEQVKLFMKKRNQGKTQEDAAAQCGFSERSGRRIDKGVLQPSDKKKRSWRTRQDPFVKVWESEIVPLLSNEPELTPMTLFERLQKDHPGEYPDSKLRTFQRKVSKWKTLYGADKEVMFRQNQVVGRMGLSDFTKLKQVQVTIEGEVFHHLLYHFRLAFSGWCSVKVVRGGESYAAFAEGLQDALQRLGGSPLEHRSDSLSAAFKNLNKDAATDITKRYEQLCKHYDMVPTRNNRGKGHENGAVESPHGHLKKRIHQGLLLRGSNDFRSISEYEDFLSEIVQTINQNKQDKIEEERNYLQPLPLQRTADYTELVVRVSTSSTIRVKRVLYTVPSRLIGRTLRIHIYDSRLEVYLGANHTETLDRIFVKNNNHRAKQVDYRHVITSLERKPQAFRYSQLRDELLPDDNYKAVWEFLDLHQDARKACKTMVGILALAHRANCEEKLGTYLHDLLEKKIVPNLYKLQQKFDTNKPHIPKVFVTQPPVSTYDSLLATYSTEVH